MKKSTKTIQDLVSTRKIVESLAVLPLAVRKKLIEERLSELRKARQDQT